MPVISQPQSFPGDDRENGLVEKPDFGADWSLRVRTILLRPGDFEMKRSVLSMMLVAGLLVVSPVWGAGLWLYEMGTPDLGTAAAGRAAMASDASTAGADPAGMTRLDRSQVLVGFQGLYTDIHFDTDASGFGGGDGGNAGGSPMGSLHYVHHLTPDWKLGISVGSYFGLGVDYGENWSGRYYMQEAKLTTFGVNPGVGYQVSDWLSVGAGFSILYAELLQKSAINNAAVPGQAGLGDGQLKIESDDVGYGSTWGSCWSPWRARVSASPTVPR